jgi:hypothetical protein
MPIPRTIPKPAAPADALAAALWFARTDMELETLTTLLDSGAGTSVMRPGTAGRRLLPGPRLWGTGRPGAATTILRQAVVIAPEPVRPYFAVCALEAWRRVPVKQLASWSGIPLSLLKRRLASWGLTPAGVAAWNFALHATWLLDVAQLPTSTVVTSMRLGRPAALAAVLGARGVSLFGGEIQAGAFSLTLENYVDLLRAAFRA